MHRDRAPCVTLAGPPPHPHCAAGAFTLPQVHAWAAAALPDLPPNLPSLASARGGGGEARYSFRSTQAGSLLGCSLIAGAARFVRCRARLIRGAWLLGHLLLKRSARRRCVPCGCEPGMHLNLPASSPRCQWSSNHGLSLSSYAHLAPATGRRHAATTSARSRCSTTP
jgi:hypothetical protein